MLTTMMCYLLGRDKKEKKKKKKNFSNLKNIFKISFVFTYFH